MMLLPRPYAEVKAEFDEALHGRDYRALYDLAIEMQGHFMGNYLIIKDDEFRLSKQLGDCSEAAREEIIDALEILRKAKDTTKQSILRTSDILDKIETGAL
jgi:hypothetical protein